MKNREAIKSMIQLGLGVVLLVGMWAIIGRLVFPSQETAVTPASYVQAHAPLLTQIAENAMDPEKWAGIRDTDEVQAVLAEGKIQIVTGYETCARFSLPYDNPDGTLAILYLPDDQYVFSFDGEWAQESAEGDTQRWVGGTAGQGYVNVTRLAESFYLEEACNPA
ncbi:MAG: hypothetical protein ACI4MF_11635 [Candidatus Faecivicinus sp.]